MLWLALSILAKTTLYAACLTASGLVLAGLTLRHGDNPHLKRVMQIAAQVLIVSALISLFILFLRLGGGFDLPTLAAVTESPSGIALMLQVGGGGLLCCLPRQRYARWISVLAILSGFGFAGHAAARTEWAGPVAGLHVALAAWWTGGLWRMLSVRDDHTFVPLVHTFGRQALWIIVCLVGAGLILIVALMGTQIDMYCDYAKGLQVKLFFFSGILGLAVANRWQLTPHLETIDLARSRLVLSIRAELWVILAIVFSTACLTTLTYPMRHDSHGMYGSTSAQGH